MLANAQTLKVASARPAASRRSARGQAVTVRASAREERAGMVALPRRDLLAGAVIGIASVRVPDLRSLDSDLSPGKRS